jgi:capsular polysaccharide biosynthesis protein
MGVLVSSRLPPSYESEARLLVGPLAGNHDVIQGAGEQARTYAALATTSQILVPAARRLGTTPASLRAKLDVTASDVTRFVTVRASDGNAVRGAAIANVVAEELRTVAAAGGIELGPEGQLTIIDRATPSTDQSGPSTALIAALAALGGLLGALGLAALADALGTTVRNEQELADLVPVNVLGSVDGSRGGPGGIPAVEANPNSKTAAAYRLLAAKIELSNGGPPARSIVVVDAQEGRSGVSLAANLAAALGEGRGQVALVDSSEDGAVLSLYGPADGRGRSGGVKRGRPVRIGGVTLDRFRIPGSRLIIIRPRKAAEPIEISQATDVLEQVLVHADFAIVSVPPLDRSASGLVWSRAAEATLLVTERDHTKREQVPAAVESLRLAGANLIGVVLCGTRFF